MIQLSIRQLDDSRFVVSVPADATINRVKHVICKDVAKGLTEAAITLVFTGRVCTDSISIADILPSVTQGLTALTTSGGLIPVSDDWKVRNASGIIDEEIRKTISSPTTDDTMDKELSEFIEKLLKDREYTKEFQRGPSVPVPSSLSPVLPRSVKIHTILNEILEFDLPRPASEEMTVAHVRNCIHAHCGVPPLAQQLHVWGKLHIPQAWNSAPVRALSSNLGTTLQLTMAYSPECVLSTEASTVVIDGSRVPDTTSVDSTLHSLMSTSFLHFTERPEHAQSAMTPICMEGSFGNDARTGRLRGVCKQCNTLGAHFEPRVLCPCCPMQHESVLILAGYLPAPVAEVSSGGSSGGLFGQLYVPPRHYKWKDFAGIVIRCLLCQYHGQPRIGFVCRAVKVDGVPMTSDYDIPPASSPRSGGKRVIEYCSSRVCAASIAGTPLAGISPDASECDDPIVPPSGVHKKVYAAAGSGLKESVCEIVCSMPG